MTSLVDAILGLLLGATLLLVVNGGIFYSLGAEYGLSLIFGGVVSIILAAAVVIGLPITEWIWDAIGQKLHLGRTITVEIIDN